MASNTKTDPQSLKRWRMILNLTSQKQEEEDEEESLTKEEKGKARVLGELYYGGSGKAGLGASQPQLHRWLGDIRTYFPKPVVQMMQKDAIDRHHIEELLLEPEVLEQIEPDVHLVANLLSLQKVLPDRVKSTAREVVQKVIEDLEKKFQPLLLKAIRGRIHRSSRMARRNPSAIDWPRVIRANLRHYQPEYNSIIPVKWYSFGHRRRGVKRLILLVDQSASMSASVVYSGIFGSVLAGIRSLSTHLVLFDTSVVDMTEHLSDPIDVLFGAQLGGGTDIGKALGYAETLVRDPGDTHLFLISDLDEGGRESVMLKRMHQLVQRGVHLQVLLNLSDEGQSYYSERMARRLQKMGISSFACTPDQFPDVLAGQMFGS